MKVLVTGATGFLGGALVKRLFNDGFHVTAVGRNDCLLEGLSHGGIVSKKLDLIVLQDVMNAVKDQEIVFHCAALSSPWGSWRDFYNANVIATRNIISACQARKVRRLIFVSTPSIYFDFKDRLGIKEGDPLARCPANHYVKTKLQAEQEVDRAALQGLEVITFRPRGIFGPGDTTIFPRMIRANRRTGIPWINDAQSHVDITYVENVVDALILGMRTDKRYSGQKYNITNDAPMLLKDLWMLLFAELKEPMNKISMPRPLALMSGACLVWTL